MVLGGVKVSELGPKTWRQVSGAFFADCDKHVRNRKETCLAAEFVMV